MAYLILHEPKLFFKSADKAWRTRREDRHRLSGRSVCTDHPGHRRGGVPLSPGIHRQRQTGRHLPHPNRKAYSV